MADARAKVIDDYFRGRYKQFGPYDPEIGAAIIAEVERMGEGGLYLSTACALVEQESGGRNVFGCDLGPRQSVPFCNQRVTKKRVAELLTHIARGGASNGVGYTQLTYPPYIREAERLGGAHRPRINMRVGFKVLNDLIEKLGWPAGAAAYNAGEGNWRSVMNTYGEQMQIKEREWAARLSRASDGKEKPMPEPTPKELAEKAILQGMKLLGIPYGPGWKEGTWPDGAPLYARVNKRVHTFDYAKRNTMICSGLINFLRMHVAGLPAIGRAQGDAWPGGTAAIYRQWCRLKGVRPYPPVENTPRGWLVYSPYLGPALPMQGHVGIALGDGKVLEARVPTLSRNRTEHQGHMALINGGAQGYTHIIPPSVWMAL